MPRRPYQFIVLKPFEAVVAGCLNVYHQGYAYTVRAGEPWDDLDSKIAQWTAEGKVAVVGGG